MDEVFLWQTLSILEDRVTDENQRMQIYLDLLPIVTLIDPTLPDQISETDPVFAEAIEVWKTDEGLY